MIRLARAIVGLYPSAWRERYATEVDDLLSAGSVRLADVCGLLRHCIAERVLSMYEPARHISAFRLITGITLIVYVTTLMAALLLAGAVPFGLGFVLRQTTGPIPDGVLDTLSWIYLSGFVVVVVPAFIMLLRHQFKAASTGPARSPSPAHLRWVIVGGYVGLAFLQGLQPDLTWRDSLRGSFSLVWLMTFVLRDFPENVDHKWPGRDVFETLGRLRGVRYDLRWARMELERCEGLYEGREPGPELRAARSELTRLLSAEADALASLDAMGYHARFQS